MAQINSLARAFSRPKVLLASPFDSVSRSYQRDRDPPPHRQASWDAPAYAPHDEPRPKAKRVKQVPSGPGPPPTEAELAKRAAMRVKRAERLERKDLTTQLTPTKTYMGGFTQPRHLAFLNTLDPTRKEKDSHAVRVGASRVRPAAEAYEPHVVYLAVTRYPIRWGHGRATRRECFSGYCKESELGQRMDELNYGIWKMPVAGEEGEAHWECRSESKEYLDLAVWPDSPEARSLANKQYYSVRKALAKAAGTDPKTKIDPSLLPSFLPPVSPDWTRPPPPYLSPRLVVPLLTVTLPTRPLAATLSRLCNGHPRGLPFVASVPNEDRKDGPAFFRRLLRMRANRIRDLTGEIVEKLQGFGGGFFGLRLNQEDKGRGVEGEMLGEDIEAPGGNWVQVKRLEEGSECWAGIERDVFAEGWKEGVEVDGTWTEEGTVFGEEKEEAKRAEEVPVEAREETRAEATLH